MSGNSFRKHLSMPGMLRAMRACFARIPDPINTGDFNLSDCLMSALAVFPRCFSLTGLQFDRASV